MEENKNSNEQKIFPKGVKPINISKEVRSSFLDYAMSVIVARALPDVRDGLKPVHRRILFSMNSEGMHADRPYKKSARIVGDVIGKYHPHGDSAVYEALVRLAQDFSCRYPLVDGHGNFGSIDGDSAAAMRYTESKMSKIAMELVKDINKNTVDFVENYDGEEKEPVVLPAKFPNLLVNGSTGIAVGMATNIPPHNLTEVINGVLALIKNPDITVLELMSDFIFGPDFPTGGIILGKSGIKKAYETGNGTLVLRSRSIVEDMEHNKKRIIVSEIPYQVNKATMIERMADLVRNKLIDGITDLRDESNLEGIRIVIELRKDAIPEVILNQLYKLSSLQTTFSINMLALVNGEPRILPIIDVLNHYINYQVEIIRRRTTYELEKALDKQHILEGLSIAGQNIDEVIHIIKSSDDGEHAANRLSERFGLSDKQIKAILDMRLQRLTGIEQTKIDSELQDLLVTIQDYQAILSNDSRVKEIMESELIDIRDRYGDRRKTEISNESFDIEDEDLIPKEDIIITLTTNGYVKRVATDTYKVQNRGGKGIKGMSTNEDDIVDQMLITNTHTDILFFTNLGKVYRIRGYQIPEYSRQSKGLPIVNLLNMPKEEVVKAMIRVDEYHEDHNLFFVTKLGIVKRVVIKEFESIRQNGKIAMSLRDGDELFDVKVTTGNEEIIIASSAGKAVRFNESQARVMGRNASGVRGIDLDEAIVIGVTTSLEGKYILSICENGFGKMSQLEEYRLTNRGGKGVITINASERNGKLVGMKAVEGSEDLLVTTNKGIIIRVSLDQVAISGRNAQGVRIIRPDEDQTVGSIAVMKKEEEIENMIEDEAHKVDEVIVETIQTEKEDIE